MLLNMARGRLALVAAATTAMCAATAPTARAGDDAPVVVATTSIWADIVDQLDCQDDLDVQVLVPVGGDPHSYEPSMQDRDRLTSAALVVVNGAGLEDGIGDTIAAAAGDGAPVLVITDHVTTHDLSDGEHTDDDVADLDTADEGDHDDGDHVEDDHDSDERDHDTDGGHVEDDHDTDERNGEVDDGDHDHDDGVDPHVWQDPTLVAEALPALGDALVAAGADADGIAACRDELAASLAELDEQIAGVVATIPAERRLLVTNHDSLGYFARRYGFEVLGSVLPSTSTLVEASPGELDALGEAIEAADVPAIFAEALETTDDADALGDRLGVDVVMLYTDSLGDDDSGASTYQTMMLADATAIADALAA